MKKKRVRSILCFGPPPVADDENEKREWPVKDSTASIKGNNRRLILKVIRSMSLKSNSSNRSEKSPKNSFCPLAQKASESLRNQSDSNSFGKNLESSILFSHLSSSSSISTSEAILKLDCRKTYLPPPAQVNYRYATGLCFLLLSLFVMVFCGRLCAILCTATCLGLVPRWRAGGISPEFTDVAPTVTWKESYREEVKKRIVLEGFLRRQKKTMQI